MPTLNRTRRILDPMLFPDHIEGRKGLGRVSDDVLSLISREGGATDREIASTFDMTVPESRLLVDILRIRFRYRISESRTGDGDDRICLYTPAPGGIDVDYSFYLSN